jgi:hypothetical protein
MFKAHPADSPDRVAKKLVPVKPRILLYFFDRTVIFTNLTKKEI